jgi:hypothetical protein
MKKENNENDDDDNENNDDDENNNDDDSTNNTVISVSYDSRYKSYGYGTSLMTGDANRDFVSDDQ